MKARAKCNRVVELSDCLFQWIKVGCGPSKKAAIAVTMTAPATGGSACAVAAPPEGMKPHTSVTFPHRRCPWKSEQRLVFSKKRGSQEEK
jgi:hypothetical protein